MNCKHTVELLSQAHERRLGRRERLKLVLHLALCGGCRNARKHFLFIRDACAAWLGRDE